MSELPDVDLGKKGNWSPNNAASPFRYPGGKGFMSEYLASRIREQCILRPTAFCEPFCGGAGAALNLLKEGEVDTLHLNDADLRINSAWKAILEESERFVEAIEVVPLTMVEWYRQQEIVTAGADRYSFELGFATFFMNRTTRSGIVERAGPIGGYSQDGRWKIDARFNRSGLIQKVEWIAQNKDKITLSNIDALTFISQKAKSLDLSSAFFFIDPPYVKAGGRLYFNGMNEAKHIALADILVSGSIPHWVLTYDDAPLIRSLYREAVMGRINVNYSLQSKRKEMEILVLPDLGG